VAEAAGQAVPIFVVNLASAPLRREHICAHLDSLGLAYEVVDAVDGRLLSEEERRQFAPDAATMSPGAIGCFLSHLEVYRRILASGRPMGLLLEDDARLNPAFAPLLKHGFPTDGFDYLFLDCEVHNCEGPVFYDAARPREIGGGFQWFPLSAGPDGAHAVILTAEAARRRLENALPMPGPIDVYTYLPETFRFGALVFPKGAFLGEDSLVSFTSDRELRASRPRFGFLRRYAALRWLRDAMRPRRWRQAALARQWVREGRLPRDARWRPLPAGRVIVEVSGAPLDER
jgi:glycosyl transferase, family 25